MAISGEILRIRFKASPMISIFLSIAFCVFRSPSKIEYLTSAGRKSYICIIAIFISSS